MSDETFISACNKFREGGKLYTQSEVNDLLKKQREACYHDAGRTDWFLKLSISKSKELMKAILNAEIDK